MKNLFAQAALIFIFFFLIRHVTFAQNRERFFEQALHNYLFSEIHLVPHDSLVEVHYSFRIPYERFVFLKSDKGYTAKFRVSIEVTDSLSNHVTRQTEDKIITTDSFDETLSGDTYSEGLINFEVKTGIYHLLPIVTDHNSNRDLRLPSMLIIARSKNVSGFLKPVVVDENKLNCSGKQFFQLTNFNDFIPFSENKYSFIIPSTDTTLKSIRVVIKKDADTLYDKKINRYFDSNVSFSECRDKVLLGKNNDSKIDQRNFIVDNFSQKLEEGAYLIYIFKDKELKPIKHFPFMVEWINKPFSLRNPKKAISYLDDFENSKTVDSLLSNKSSLYEKVLFNFWKRYDPTPRTEFNPLMNEFYLRIDYAEKNFSTLSGRNGASTDRGKIYIKYGKPKEVERASNEYGKMVEKWIYKDPIRIFKFVEKDGTGNYILQKG